MSKIYIYFEGGYWRAQGQDFPYYRQVSHKTRDGVITLFKQTFPKWCDRETSIEFVEIDPPYTSHDWGLRARMDGIMTLTDPLTMVGQHPNPTWVEK